MCHGGDANQITLDLLVLDSIAGWSACYIGLIRIRPIKPHATKLILGVLKRQRA